MLLGSEEWLGLRSGSEEWLGLLLGEVLGDFEAQK
jgi:hypothetical protein